MFAIGFIILIGLCFYIVSEQGYKRLCAGDNLTSLKGCPQEVSGDFDCSFNQLTTFEYALQKVGGNFTGAYNPLISLKGYPHFGGGFRCDQETLDAIKRKNKH